MKHKAIHWPDHAIGKRESRTIREAHNALYNDYHELRSALEVIKAGMADDRAYRDYARAVIATAER